MPLIIDYCNSYCVPTALAALTTGRVADAIKLLHKCLGDVNANRPLFYPIILQVLQNEGYIIEREQTFTTVGTYLLCFKSHVGVVENGTYIDNSYPKGKLPINLTKLEACYRITKGEGSHKPCTK